MSGMDTRISGYLHYRQSITQTCIICTTLKVYDNGRLTMALVEGTHKINESNEQQQQQEMATLYFTAITPKTYLEYLKTIPEIKELIAQANGKAHRTPVEEQYLIDLKAQLATLEQAVASTNLLAIAYKGLHFHQLMSKILSGDQQAEETVISILSQPDAYRRLLWSGDFSGQSLGDKTALWLLVFLAVQNDKQWAQDALNAMLSQELTELDWTKPATIGATKGITPFWMLVDAGTANKEWAVNALIKLLDNTPLEKLNVNATPLGEVIPRGQMTGDKSALTWFFVRENSKLQAKLFEALLKTNMDNHVAIAILLYYTFPA